MAQFLHNAKLWLVKVAKFRASSSACLMQTDLLVASTTTAAAKNKTSISKQSKIFEAKKEDNVQVQKSMKIQNHGQLSHEMLLVAPRCQFERGGRVFFC